MAKKETPIDDLTPEELCKEIHDGKVTIWAEVPAKYCVVCGKKLPAKEVTEK